MKNKQEYVGDVGEVDDASKFIPRRVLRQDIKSYLQGAIMKGELKPGTRIVETKIAKELGVSQAPVREAIRELELMGLIESLPFQGAFVKRLSRQDIHDAYQLRAHLEALAAREAVRKVSAEQLKQMRRLVSEMNEAANREKMTEFVELDIAFHGLILDIAGNKLLKKMWNMVHLGQWTFITTLISRRSLPELAQRHELILDSFNKRDAKEAEAMMEKHIRDVEDEVLQNFSED